MLINCPRCGFEQPQDKYCAQCGVDMENFKPKKKSKDFFSGALIQTLFILLIVAGLGFAIYTKTSSRTVVDVDQPTSRRAATMASQQRIPATAPQQVVASQDAGAVSTQQPSPPPPTADATENHAAGNGVGPRITIRYAEISRQALQALSDESQNTGQFVGFSDYSAGIIPDVEKHVHSDGVKILHSEEKNLGSSKSVRWFYGLKDRNDPMADVGLATFLSLELADPDSNTFRGNVEVQRDWRDLGQNQTLETQRKSFPAIFEIGNGAGFFMAGIMPRKSNLDNEDELTSIDIYKILRSPAFQKGESEFIMFIEMSKDDSTSGHH